MNYDLGLYPKEWELAKKISESMKGTDETTAFSLYRFRNTKLKKVAEDTLGSEESPAKRARKRDQAGTETDMGEPPSKRAATLALQGQARVEGAPQLCLATAETPSDPPTSIEQGSPERRQAPDPIGMGPHQQVALDRLSPKTTYLCGFRDAVVKIPLNETLASDPEYQRGRNDGDAAVVQAVSAAGKVVVATVAPESLGVKECVVAFSQTGFPVPPLDQTAFTGRFQQEEKFAFMDGWTRTANLLSQGCHKLYLKNR